MNYVTPHMFWSIIVFYVKREKGLCVVTLVLRFANTVTYAMLTAPSRSRLANDTSCLRDVSEPRP